MDCKKVLIYVYPKTKLSSQGRWVGVNGGSTNQSGPQGVRSGWWWVVGGEGVRGGAYGEVGNFLGRGIATVSSSSWLFGCIWLTKRGRGAGAWKIPRGFLG